MQLLGASAEVQADVTYTTLTIESGAQIEGKLQATLALAAGIAQPAIALDLSKPGAAAALQAPSAAGERSGKLVAELDHVTKRFGERTIIRDFTLRIQRGDRIGIVGANGTGKTMRVAVFARGDKADAALARAERVLAQLLVLARVDAAAGHPESRVVQGRGWR